MDDYQIDQSVFISELGSKIGQLESDLIALRILLRQMQNENAMLKTNLAEAQELVGRFYPE